MKRRASDRRVRIVMATMERALASPYAQEDGIVAATAGAFVTWASISGWFDDGARWEPQALASIVLAYALNAPSRKLDELVRIAHDQLEWVEWWDTIGWAEARGYAPLLERAA